MPKDWMQISVDFILSFNPKEENVYEVRIIVVPDDTNTVFVFNIFSSKKKSR